MKEYMGSHCRLGRNSLNAYHKKNIRNNVCIK